MRFIAAIGSGFRNYARFSGRANRREFWAFTGFVVVAWLVLLLADLHVVAPMRGFMPMEDGAGYPLSNGWLLICLVPVVALTVRRVQDNDRSAWFAVMVLPLPYLLSAKGTKGPNRYG